MLAQLETDGRTDRQTDKQRMIHTKRRRRDTALRRDGSQQLRRHFVKSNCSRAAKQAGGQSCGRCWRGPRLITIYCFSDLTLLQSLGAAKRIATAHKLGRRRARTGRKKQWTLLLGSDNKCVCVFSEKESGSHKQQPASPKLRRQRKPPDITRANTRNEVTSISSIRANIAGARAPSDKQRL